MFVSPASTRQGSRLPILLLKTERQVPGSYNAPSRRQFPQNTLPGSANQSSEW
jgi:hypothetical protein